MCYPKCPRVRVVGYLRQNVACQIKRRIFVYERRMSVVRSEMEKSYHQPHFMFPCNKKGEIFIFLFVLCSFRLIHRIPPLLWTHGTCSAAREPGDPQAGPGGVEAVSPLIIFFPCIDELHFELQVCLFNISVEISFDFGIKCEKCNWVSAQIDIG